LCLLSCSRRPAAPPVDPIKESEAAHARWLKGFYAGPIAFNPEDFDATLHWGFAQTDEYRRTRFIPVPNPAPAPPVPLEVVQRALQAPVGQKLEWKFYVARIEGHAMDLSPIRPGEKLRDRRLNPGPHPSRIDVAVYFTADDVEKDEPTMNWVYGRA